MLLVENSVNFGITWSVQILLSCSFSPTCPRSFWVPESFTTQYRCGNSVCNWFLAIFSHCWLLLRCDSYYQIKDGSLCSWCIYYWDSVLTIASISQVHMHHVFLDPTSMSLQIILVSQPVHNSPDISKFSAFLPTVCWFVQDMVRLCLGPI